ncbi:MAG: hypothetical protein J7K15_10305 [Deltaproteobacteria bacterium]|nr:hypothetical protein [Deltaproteobacteria bacterium]
MASELLDFIENTVIKKIVELDRRVKKLESDVQSYFDAYEKTIADFKEGCLAPIEALMEKMQKVLTEIAELRKQLAKLSTEVKELREELNEVKDEVRDLRDEVEK